MYVQRDCVAHSRNYCLREKAIFITSSEFVSVALVIEHAKSMRHIVICGLSACAVIFNIIS
jgi:hypothetical protein